MKKKTGLGVSVFFLQKIALLKDPTETTTKPTITSNIHPYACNYTKENILELQKDTKFNHVFIFWMNYYPLFLLPRKAKL